MPRLAVETELGRLVVEERAGAVVSLRWRGEDEGEPTPLLDEAAAQLRAYADKRLFAFDLPLDPAGGPLVQAVMAEMRKIPFGETTTYGDIAKAVGAAPQAVGQACGSNPIPIVIPCHRVTGTGWLGGFSADEGVEAKVRLLRHEGAYSLLI